MNTLSGLRPNEPSLSGTGGAAGWPAATGPVSAPAGPSGTPRWLEGLAGADTPVLSADLPPGAGGLTATEHAQRVLSALLGD